MDKKLSNAGFSLVELIIVIGIMGIMVGGSMNMISYLNLGNVKKCANMINSYLGETRADALSKADNPSLIIYKCSKGIYAYKTFMDGSDDSVVLDGSVGEKITNYNIVVKYTDEAGNAYGELEDASGISVADMKNNPTGANSKKVIVVKFKKSTGAFSDSLPFYSQLEVSNSTRTYRVNMVKETGRFFVE